MSERERTPESLRTHRVSGCDPEDVCRGRVRWSPANSLWFTSMALGATVGGAATLSWPAVTLFVVTTAVVLLFGHSLGSHRKLIHDSYACPRRLELAFAYCGVLVGLAGPFGLLRQHGLRDYAQRLPRCHAYLRHGCGFWRDAWWQLHCELVLDRPPALRLEPRIANDRVLAWLEATWRWQQLPWAVLFWWWGGWGFVFWGVCARVTAGVFGHWLVGWFAHNAGDVVHEVRGAAVQGRNVRWVSLLTMGESWHNNHHAFPGSARLGLAKGEWDPGWWALVLLQRAGLVWNVTLPGDLPPRPELLRIPRATVAPGRSGRSPGGSDGGPESRGARVPRPQEAASCRSGSFPESCACVRGRSARASMRHRHAPQHPRSSPTSTPPVARTP